MTEVGMTTRAGQHLTPVQSAAWFKRQSDEQIAHLKAHNVWYGPRHTRPEPDEPEAAAEPEPEEPEPTPVLRPGMSLPDCIIVLCAHAQRVSVPALRSNSRRETTVRARQFAAYLMRKHCKTADDRPMSMPAIGQKLGGRDHSTVLHSVRRVQADLEDGGKEVGPIIAHVERELGVA